MLSWQTRNTIFMLRMLPERAIQMQKPVLYRLHKGIHHKDLLELLGHLDIFGNDIRIIQNLYWQQTACIRIENESSRYAKIERGIRQGWVFSPHLFNQYSETVLRELDVLTGFITDGHNLNNIRYEDDTVLIADMERKLQKLLQKVVKESDKKGQSINCKKTECMVVSKRISPKCKLQIGNTKIK